MPTPPSRPNNPLHWNDLEPESIRVLIRRALEEDLLGKGLRHPPRQKGDTTSSDIPVELCGEARVVNRHAMVICGLPAIEQILQECIELTALPDSFVVDREIEDGTFLEEPTTLATIKGSAQLLLIAERTILNFLQHLSGVASLTRRYRKAMGETKTRLLDTRKTTPGYRFLEKYAVGCGGGTNHRLGLFDRLLLKDNHLAAGSFVSGPALSEYIRGKKATYPELEIEVEVDRLDQIEPALAGGVDYLMLDNFSDEDTVSALELCRGRCLVELSGGITLENLPAKAKLGADFISTGAITHQSTWPDIGLDWKSG